jgi:hypothetical protein
MEIILFTFLIIFMIISFVSGFCLLVNKNQFGILNIFIGSLMIITIVMLYGIQIDKLNLTKEIFLDYYLKQNHKDKRIENLFKQDIIKIKVEKYKDKLENNFKE